MNSDERHNLLVGGRVPAPGMSRKVDFQAFISLACGDQLLT